MNHLFFCSLDGDIITPNSPKYEEARQEWNRSIQRFPAAIFYCESIGDVSDAIVYARDNNIPIRIRSGGHNYEGYSTGNSVLVIDISRLDSIYIDEEDEIVTVQGGVKNKDLYEKLAQLGYPFPGGTCPTVGVSGYTLGGGWGYGSRLYGLGSDNLVEVQVVDYRGYLVTADKEMNADLFWACRGAGGGNFGVVVSMTFKLPKKIDAVTLFEVYLPSATEKNQLQFMQIWQDWIRTTSNEINMNAAIYNAVDDGIYIYGRGLYFGKPADALTVLQPFTNIKNLDIYVDYLSFEEAMTQIESSYPESEKFKSSGRFVNREYTNEELTQLISIVNQPRPQGSVLTSIGVYGLGGKVKEYSSGDSAYYYRDAAYLVNMQTVWEDDRAQADNINWFETRFPSVYQLTKGSYVNFPYAQLSNPEVEYYGENVTRLRYIKYKYDPYNVFAYPQGIKR